MVAPNIDSTVKSGRLQWDGRVTSLAKTKGACRLSFGKYFVRWSFGRSSWIWENEVQMGVAGPGCEDGRGKSLTGSCQLAACFDTSTGDSDVSSPFFNMRLLNPIQRNDDVARPENKNRLGVNSV